MKQLIKYGNKRFRLLNVHLKKYKQHARPEQLHRVRVELKKIKTLFDLLAFSSKNFDSSLAYKPLKNIFRKAGLIRESDVLYQLVKGYKLERFEKDIIPEVKKKNLTIVGFHRKTGLYKKITKRICRKTEKYLAEVSRKSFSKYIFKTGLKLNKKLFPKFRQDELHKIRKQIKKIIFLSQMMNSNHIPQKIKLYDKLQNIIGNWHDKNVLIGLLKENRSSSYKTIVRKLRAGCARDLKLINPLLATLHHK